MRVILVDDASLVREGIARLLEDEGVEVIAQLSDASGLLRAVDEDTPDAVVIDVRMPPTHTTEGLRAALAGRIFAELGLEADPSSHRRVLAVLAHLRAGVTDRA